MDSKKVNPRPSLLILIFLDITGICILNQNYNGVELIQYASFYTIIITSVFIMYYIFRIKQKHRFDAINEEVMHLDANNIQLGTIESE
jgi:cbb3-type cytochrome oxidase subunit 3